MCMCVLKCLSCMEEVWLMLRSRSFVLPACFLISLKTIFTSATHSMTPQHTHTLLFCISVLITLALFFKLSECVLFVCVCTCACQVNDYTKHICTALRSGTCFHSMNMQVIFYAHTGCKTISHNISATDGPRQPY